MNTSSNTSNSTNWDPTSSEDEFTPNTQDQPRTARKSTRASQQSLPQSRDGPSTRREAAKKASEAISAAASSSGASSGTSTSGTSTGTSSFDKTMENFNPDMSAREQRKISQKFHTAAAAPAAPKPIVPVYDEKGIHIATGKDLCDCLMEKCPGCFFQCVKCGSQKCGTACRVQRNYIIESIEYHGQEKILKNPLLKK